MAEVVEAHAAYKKADEEALLMRFRARAKLGLAVEIEYTQRRSSLKSIAEKLGVVDEQVRRYRQAYKDWQRDHPDKPLDAEAAAPGTETPN